MRFDGAALVVDSLEDVSRQLQRDSVLGGLRKLLAQAALSISPL